MSDGFEAAARAVANFVGRKKNVSCDEIARAAIEAYEAEQWVAAETCVNEDGNEFISDAGWIVFWHDGSRNHWKRPGWYDVTDDLLTAKPCAVKRLRPLPEPPKSEGDGR